MNRSPIYPISAILIIAVSLFNIPSLQLAQAIPVAKLEFTQDSYLLNEGETFTMTIFLNTSIPIGYLQFNVTWNANNLEFVSYEHGSAVQDALNTVDTSHVSQGYIRVGYITVLGLNSGDVLILTFRAKSKGNTSIAINVEEVADLSGNPVEISGDIASITIQKVADARVLFDKETYIIGESTYSEVHIQLVTGSTQVGGLQFNVTWDPEYLEFVNYTIGDAAVSAMSNINDQHTDEGYIIAGFLDITGMSSGEILVLTFKGKTEGNTTLQINIKDAADTSANPIDATGDTATVVVRPVTPPVANFTVSPLNPFVGEEVTFNASASYDPDGFIVEYIWDFGDGVIVTTESPIVTHVYTSGGEKTVKLTVVDNESACSTANKTIMVRSFRIYLPNATVSINREEVVSVSLVTTEPLGALQFTISYNSSIIEVLNVTSSHLMSYTINNSSIMIGIMNPNGISSGPLVSLKIRGIGTGTSLLTGNILTAVDLNTQTEYGAILSGYVTVEYLPIANFTFAPEEPWVGQEVTFNASASYDPDGFIVEYIWDFGDGTTLNTTEPIVTHVYTSGGVKNVTLMVVDDKGVSSTITKSLRLLSFTLKLPDGKVRVNKTVDLPITLNTTEVLGSLQFIVTFDPAFMEIVNVTSDIGMIAANISEGYVQIGIISVSGLTSGEIVKLSIKGISNGTTELEGGVISAVTPSVEKRFGIVLPGELEVYKRRLGDANDDGIVDVLDALIYLRFAVGLDTPLYDLDPEEDDITGDGKITAVDAIIVLRAAVGLETLE